MKVFDIVSEATVKEFYQGDAQQYKISRERLRELGLTTPNGWHPYGNDETPFEYNDQNLIALLDAALGIFAEHDQRMTDPNQINTFKRSVINFLRTDGAQARRNINNLFKHFHDNANPPIKYNEALGQMLNLLYNVVSAARESADDRDDEERVTNDPTAPAYKEVTGAGDQRVFVIYNSQGTELRRGNGSGPTHLLSKDTWERNQQQN